MTTNSQIPGHGLLGHPLGHSMSPFIHQALFELSGRPQPYDLYDVPPENLETEVPKLLTRAGFNITIPYKVAVIPFLTQLSEKAELYQSVNTVEIKDGGYIGHNTDVDGFLHGIRSLGAELSQGPVLMLGSGGVANMIATEVILAGSPLTIAVRKEDVEQAAALKTAASDHLPGCGNSKLPAGRTKRFLPASDQRHPGGDVSSRGRLSGHAGGDPKSGSGI